METDGINLRLEGKRVFCPWWFFAAGLRRGLASCHSYRPRLRNRMNPRCPLRLL